MTISSSFYDMVYLDLGQKLSDEIRWPKNQMKIRKCLRCGRPHKSKHFGDRICAHCNITNSRASVRAVDIIVS